VDNDTREPIPAPTAKGKWLTASVVDNAASVVTEIFKEADRRDPTHQRSWVALVDGNNHQIDRITKEAATRDVEVVIDLIHVLEYLWPAAWSFHDEGDRAAEAWVADKARQILAGKAGLVAAAIRRKATRHRLDPPNRKNADRCADYLARKQAYLDSTSADRRLAHRHRCDRGRLPPPGQGPHGHHRSTLEPQRCRSDPETACIAHQRRLRRLLDLPPRTTTATCPPITLHQQQHPTGRMTHLQKSRTHTKADTNPPRCWPRYHDQWIVPEKARSWYRGQHRGGFVSAFVWVRLF